MSAPVILAVDAGTSVIKAVAFDLEGRQLAAAARPNRYESLPDRGAVQDLARTWDDTAAVLRELTERLPDLPGRAAALAVTGQGDGTWLIDRDGAPVGPGWLWLDARAAGIVEEFEAACVRRALFQITGSGLNACNQSSQLVWMERNTPELLDRATTAFHCKDWLYFRLTGQRHTDISEGTFTFGDFRRRRYAPEVLDMIGLKHRAHLLPPMLDGSRQTHPLSAEAAAACGLPAGLPVALGYVDVVCTGLGAGAYEPGRGVGCSIVGSTGMHLKCVAEPEKVTLPQEPGGYVMQLPAGRAVTQNQSNMAATLNIDWIVDCARQASAMLGHEVSRADALRRLDARVLDAAPGSALFHPYISEAGERGPFTDSQAHASFTGLSTRVGFAELLRAVYEGLAFAARDCYAAMGFRPEEVRLTGGAGRSKSLQRILADVLGAPVRESRREEAGAAGAAMMAAVAIGALPSIDAAVAGWTTPTLGDAVSPDAAAAARYDRLFPIYVQARQAQRPTWAALAAAREGSSA